MDLLILGAGGHGRVVKEVAEAVGDMKSAEDNVQVVSDRMPVTDRELSEKCKGDFETEISFF